MSTHDLKTGTILGRKYRIGELLGRGGMGAVYEAVQIDLDRHVALKILHAEKTDDATYLERFRLEAKTAASLGHPHIVQVTDFDPKDEDGEPPFLVMELLKGESLRKRLDTGGKIPPKRAVAIAMQTLSALEALHRANVIHRDIKPDNLFLVETNAAEDFVKVLDFGIAKHPREESNGQVLTHEGHILGTLAYMAPEQARGDTDRIDARTDVYAVAACLYHMLAGHRPFVAEGTAALWSAVMDGKFEPLSIAAPHVEYELANVVERAMSRSANARPNSAKEFCDQLEQYALGRMSAPETIVSPATTTATTPPLIKTQPMPARTNPPPPAAPVSAPILSGAPPPTPPTHVVVVHQEQQQQKRSPVLLIVLALLAVPALIGIGFVVLVILKAAEKVEARSSGESAPGSGAPGAATPKRVVPAPAPAPTNAPISLCQADCAQLIVANATSSTPLLGLYIDSIHVAEKIRALPQHDARSFRVKPGKHVVKVVEAGTDKVIDTEEIDLPTPATQLLYLPHRDPKAWCFRLDRRGGQAVPMPASTRDTWMMPQLVDRVFDVSAKDDKRAGEYSLQVDPCL